MSIRCDLCPKSCLIKPGQSGDCRIRVNVDDRKLLAVTYGFPCSVSIDPIEKKPLFHFCPGTNILSLATVGCNLHCKNCQNWEISQRNPEESSAYHVEPEMLPKIATRKKCESIAYTYTEPLVYYEYTLDSCIRAKEKGLRNVLVTAGYLNQKPLRELYPHVDAANIDLKSMSDKFYRDICSATLKPVLNAIVLAKSMGVHVEITNLLIPSLNDSDKDINELVSWIRKNLGSETPLHFSRFFPHYRMKADFSPTSAHTLERAWNIAKAQGMSHVYSGNIKSEYGENTTCSKCNSILIKRKRYQIIENRLQNGKCFKCSQEVYGRWK